MFLFSHFVQEIILQVKFCDYTFKNKIQQALDYMSDESYTIDSNDNNNLSKTF